MYIELSNVHYLPKLDANLISLKELEEKMCDFGAKDDLLQIKNKKDDILLESIKDNSVNRLQQPKRPAWNGSCHTITKACQTAKPATNKNWYKRLDHVNNDDRAKIPQIANGISFLTYDINTEPDFCKASALGKQHKVNNEESIIDTKDKLGVRLHANLFGGGNTFPGVGDYRYKR